MSRCQIVGAIVLPDSWMDRVLAEIHLADEVSRIGQERLQPSNGWNGLEGPVSTVSTWTMTISGRSALWRIPSRN